jgi:hypothetical protein
MFPLLFKLLLLLAEHIVELFFGGKVGGNTSLKCVEATKDVSMAKAKAKILGSIHFTLLVLPKGVNI